MRPKIFAKGVVS